MTYVHSPNMINSRQNTHFKHLKQLTKKRARDDEGVFLVEGKREIARVPDGDLVRVYATAGQEYPCEVIEMAPELIEELTYRGGEAIAVVKMKRASLDGLDFFVVADGMEKPGNLGAMMRTADGAGIDGVVSVGDGVDLFSPNVIRASLGAFFTRRVLQCSAEEVIKHCDKNQIPLFAATPEANKSLYEVAFPKKACIVIGSEAFGVCEELKKASTVFNLPMYGEIDSLNASTAFGIIAYEIVRQRNFV